MKQDQIIPIFKCRVIKTIMSQYCGNWLPAGVTRYIQFREPKAAWECRLAKQNDKLHIAVREEQKDNQRWNCVPLRILD
jgi:hypothetical protein